MSIAGRLPKGLGRVRHYEASAELNLTQLVRALENRLLVMNGRVQALEDERDANRAEIQLLRRQMEKLPLAVMRAFEREQKRTSELERRMTLLEGAM